MSADAPAIAVHATVSGAAIEDVTVLAATGGATKAKWSSLSTTRLDPGAYALRLSAPDAEALEVPPCAGRGRVTVDGTTYAPPAGPFVVRLARGKPHEVVIDLAVSGYERRVACGFAPRAGASQDGREGLGVLSFASPSSAQGGGRAVVFVPAGHDPKKPGALLVGAHPWDGSIWTYASYAELLAAAAARDVVLLMPSGLGNSLYVRAAEEEVMRAIDAAASVIAVDRQRVSIWGASMGGAGATTIGLHRPDRFATVTSFFGDAAYDLTTYVRSILPTPAAAHLVNALDVAPSARHVPVWLVHGEADKVSPIAQSVVLDAALRKLGYSVRFDRAPGLGHEGALVAQHIAEVVARAAAARAPEHPARVTFASARDEDVSAYGVRLVRAAAGDALFDVALDGGAVRVLAARNVKEIVLGPGALGATGAEPVAIDDPGFKGVVRRDPAATR